MRLEGDDLFWAEAGFYCHLLRISFVAGNSVSSVEVIFSWVDPTWTVKEA